jgi:hypothetical protein
MCVGYCATRLELSASGAVLVREARGGRGAPQNLPEQRFVKPISATEWKEISRLAASTDLSGLPDVIGCPDCADGGAVTLTISGDRGARTITFDHRASVAEAQPLLERVRQIREQLLPTQ